MNSITMQNVEEWFELHSKGCTVSASRTVGEESPVEIVQRCLEEITDIRSQLTSKEDLDQAYSLGLAKGRKEGEPRGRGEGIADFICYLIDNHETETITEERLQQIYAAFIKADAIRQAAQGGEGGE